MRLISFKAQNVMGIKAVEIPLGDVTVIGGANGAGKSSVLNMLWGTIAGAKVLPAKPLRKGETEGFSQVDLGDFIVERTFRLVDGDEVVTKLEIRNPDGFTLKGRQQDLLSSFVNEYMADPVAFLHLSARQQKELFLKQLGLDFAALDARYDEMFQQRRDVKRDAAKKRAAALEKPDYPDAPEQEISIAALSEELAAAEAQDRAAQQAAYERDQQAQRVMDIGGRVAELEQRLERERLALTLAQEVLAAAERKACEVQPANTSDLRARIQEAEGINAKVRARLEYNTLATEANALDEQVQAITAQLAAIEDEKASMLRGAAFPIEGVGYDGDGLTWNGLPFAQLNTAKQAEISAALVMMNPSKLKAFYVRAGNLLDSESRETLYRMAAERGYQVIVEMVSETGEGCSVLIEDGMVKGAGAPGGMTNDGP